MQKLNIDDGFKPNHAQNVRTLIDRFGFKTVQVVGRSQWRVYHERDINVVGDWWPTQNRLEFHYVNEDGKIDILSIFQAIVKTRTMEELAELVDDIPGPGDRITGNEGETVVGAKQRQGGRDLAIMMYEISAVISYTHPKHAETITRIADEVSDIIYEAGRDVKLIERLKGE